METVTGAQAYEQGRIARDNNIDALENPFAHDFSGLIADCPMCQFDYGWWDEDELLTEPIV